MTGYQSKKKAASAKLEQEPVAWRTFDGEGSYDYRSYENNEDYGYWWEERHPNHKGWVEPLYTAPPQRTWVGLTDDEYIHITDSVFHTGQGLVAYYKAIEAKLKEKNT